MFLRDAVKMNTAGTKKVLKLAEGVKNLEVRKLMWHAIKIQGAAVAFQSLWIFVVFNISKTSEERIFFIMQIHHTKMK